MGLQEICLKSKNPSQNNSLQTLFGSKLILLQIRGFARVERGHEIVSGTRGCG